MCICAASLSYFLFFFNDTATTEIYTLSLHDALPIYEKSVAATCAPRPRFTQPIVFPRSEERFSRNAETDLVCRLLLDKNAVLATACRSSADLPRPAPPPTRPHTPR